MLSEIWESCSLGVGNDWDIWECKLKSLCVAKVELKYELKASAVAIGSLVRWS